MKSFSCLKFSLGETVGPKLGGSVAQWLASLLPDPAVLGLIPVPEIVNVAEVNQQRCFVESGVWLENVDQTI